VRARADARFDQAGRVHGDRDGFPARRDLHAARGKGRAAVAGALGKCRSRCRGSGPRARFALFGAKRRQIDMGDRLIQRFDIGAFVEHQAGRRRVGKRLDEVAPADFVGIQAERGRGLVHQPLDREGDHRARHAAIGRHGAGMGRHAARHAGIGAHVVGPGQFGHRHQRLDAARGRETGIGADIGGNIRRQRDQLAVFVECAFDFDVLVAAVKAGDQVFAPVLAPGHRAAVCRASQTSTTYSAGQRHFLAKTAADIGRDDAQIGFGKPRRRRSRCARGAASAWCRSASRGRNRDRTRRARRALQAALRSGGASGA
jgi:hypothetical protein